MDKLKTNPTSAKSLSVPLVLKHMDVYSEIISDDIHFRLNS